MSGNFCLELGTEVSMSLAVHKGSQTWRAMLRTPGDRHGHQNVNAELVTKCKYSTASIGEGVTESADFSKQSMDITPSERQRRERQ